ncbi:hypothetical protein FLL45_05230 [Aliikangiella marina]|uniref:Uncharacterized protein n=1 Tax=Aliikangiella marina TaxID=1712262 RepID=A0A545TJF8_9GAMM|nr:hypothetical protein [Aliikangiella marina]TQV77348.1 hypothetical protein FLL45_05230 [Aliikangiella marina]
MNIPTKKEILCEFFEKEGLAANRWFNHPIDKLLGKTAHQILYSPNENLESIEFLFSCLEAGLFEQEPHSKPLTDKEKHFLRNAGAKGVPK